MKHILRQVFQSGKFVVGFAIFMVILLTAIIYPLIITANPLAIIGQGTFFSPGIYVNVYDSMVAPHYTLELNNAAARRIASKLGDEDRQAIKKWLAGTGIDPASIDVGLREHLHEATEKLNGKQKIAGENDHFMKADLMRYCGIV